MFCGYTNSVPSDLLAAVNNFRLKGWTKTNISKVLKEMRGKLDRKQQHQYDNPSLNRGRLFDDSYRH